MSSATITTLRLPGDVLTRADALVPILKDYGEASASGRVKNRSEVLRLAISIGLRELERRHDVLSSLQEVAPPKSNSKRAPPRRKKSR